MLITTLLLSYPGKFLPIFGAFTIPNHAFGDAQFTIVPPTSNSNGAWSYSSSDPTVLAVHASTGLATVGDAGSATITVTQAETATYNPKSTSSSALINKVNPTIGSLSIATHDTAGGSFYVTTPSSNSPGSWSFTSSNPGVVSINASTGLATIVTAGTYSITATQAATTNYNAASTSANSDITVAGPATFYGTWALITSMPVAKYGGAAVGTPTTSLYIGGCTYNGMGFGTTPAVNTSYYWNGSAWSSKAVLPVSKAGLSGCGTSTAALIAGPLISHKFNGTAWSGAATNTINTTYGGGLFGSQTSAIFTGDNTASTTAQRYNGTAWSAGPSLVTGRMATGGTGTSTAGLIVGGGTNLSSGAILPSSSNVETFDGTSFTTGPGLINRPRSLPAVSGASDNALVVGGFVIGYFNIPSTEVFNGTTWISGNNLDLSDVAGNAGSTLAGVAYAGLTTSGNTALCMGGKKMYPPQAVCQRLT